MAPGIVADSHLADNIVENSSFQPGSRDHSNPLGTRSQDPIAIIGMGCRLPGGIESPPKLWDLLSEKRSTQSAIPKSRFNIDGFYHPDLERHGSITTHGGYFLEKDSREFDNEFFGINNLEAVYMDPEQRKLLEVVFECFENAGTTLDDISGASVGCYVGKFTYDYLTIQNKDPEYMQRYNATGMSTSILANRVSHVFNLQGPSLVLDTACSSALYCLHTACTALSADECESAIVAGANLIQSPEQHIATMKAGVLSPTSTCHTFDIAADGYGRGESVGALYIKKLSKAIHDGDTIRSIIRATAVNSNGNTPGITLPSAAMQEAVIRKSYERAGLSPDDTDYVECHGTGTQVGDAIEVEALSRVFSRSTDQPLLIGSIKPSVGHSEAASAISSIIKVALALEKGEIPATYGVNKVNPKIKTDQWNMRIVTEKIKWPEKHPAHLRRASVNSFGFGGANAHAILEAADSDLPSDHTTNLKSLSSARSTLMLPFSAKNRSSLESRVCDLSLECHRGVDILDLAYTLGERRTNFAVRGYLLASQHTLENDIQLRHLRTLAAQSDISPQPLAFVFTGQGAQWPQMGLELIDQVPSFRETIRRLDAVLQALSSPPAWTIQGIISDPEATSKIGHAAYSQPVCTAIQVALVQLLAEWGVKPNHVIGHSSGEICAAYAAAQLSAEQAILVAYLRGQACAQVQTRGTMMAVGASQENAMHAIDVLEIGDKVQVACVNSPENVTLSGDHSEISQLREHFKTRNIFARELRTDGKAYHSHHMTVIGQDYEESLAAVMKLAPSAEQSTCAPEWTSTVTGSLVDSNIDHRYWRKNLESTVQFSAAVREVAKKSSVHFIEIGPHPVLELPIKQVWSSLRVEESRVLYSHTLSRGQPSVQTLLHLMGDLFLHHHKVLFSSINHVETSSPKSGDYERHGKLLTSCPNYKWKYRKTLWNECRLSEEFRNRKYKRHDILGSRMLGTGGNVAIWRNILKAKDLGWLNDHKLDGSIVFPASGYIAMTIEAACQLEDLDLSNVPSIHLQNVNISKALVLSEEGSDLGVEIHTTLHPVLSLSIPDSGKFWQFSVTSILRGETTTHADGQIAIEHTFRPMQGKLSTRYTEFEQHSVRSWYDRMSQVGLDFSGPFRSLSEISHPKERDSRHTRAITHPYLGLNGDSVYLLHPATIDGILHTALIATADGALKDFRIRIPVHIESISIQIPRSYCSDEPLIIHGVAVPIGIDSMRGAVEVSSQRDGIFIKVKNCRLVTPFHGKPREMPERHPMLRVSWKPDITSIEQGNSNFFPACLDQRSLEQTPTDDTNLQELLAALDLLAHKNPALRVSEIGNEHDGTSGSFLDCLHFNTAFKRCKAYARSTIVDDLAVTSRYIKFPAPEQYDFGKSTSAKEGSFDLLIICSSSESNNPVDLHLEKIQRVLSAGGGILGHFSSSQISELTCQGFVVTSLTEQDATPLCIARMNVLRTLGTGRSNSTSSNVVIVERNTQHPLNTLLMAKLSQEFSQPIERVHFDDLARDRLVPGSIVISTVELERPFLSTMTDEELASLKVITDSATHVIWITGGGLLAGTYPDFAVASGLSRAIMLEQPALKFATFDVDDPQTGLDRTISNCMYVVKQILSENTLDFEFVQSQGTLRISRFTPEKALNSAFRQKQGFETIQLPLEDALPCQLAFERPGELDTAYFKRVEADEQELRPGEVEVSIRSIDIDMEAMDVLGGKIDIESGKMMLQITGTVTKVGASVIDINPGDRVVSLAPGHISTEARVPEWACIKLNKEEESWVELPVLAALSTALHVLHQCARIGPGDSILIMSGASDFGISATQVARRASAEVLSVINNQDDEDFLVGDLGVPKANVFRSNSPTFVAEILNATKKNGVQLILSSPNDQLPPTIWQALADFGTTIEVGERHVGSLGASLSLSVPSRSVSFLAFSMRDLFNTENEKYKRIWPNLLQQSMKVCRQDRYERQISKKAFDIAELTQAFQYLNSSTRHRHVTITMDNIRSPLKERRLTSKLVLPFKYTSTFNPEKTYLLIGCLGGLGRSMSMWMFRRGARKFLFMGRSGLERATARSFVGNLKAKGAEVTVVKGDVGEFSDVTNAVSQINGPLGGVIQAAMGLSESLFTSITHQQWHTAMKPKVLGTWNVHNAIKDREDGLDFFLMTSSISGSVGVATETNYCASNYFLDVFARYRRSAGLAAKSIGLGMISQIGYLHEHPDIQNGLTLKGVSAIDADDFLQIIDAALSAPSNDTSDPEPDQLCRSHTLTGLEPIGLNKLRQRGFEGIPATFDDPRAALLNDALAGGTDGTSNVLASGLPADLMKAIQDGESVLESVLAVITKQFSNFLLTPVENLDTSKPLAGFGMDSMLAAAVRSWFYRKFKLDVAFMTLLSQTVSIHDLANSVSEHLLKQFHEK